MFTVYECSGPMNWEPIALGSFISNVIVYTLSSYYTGADPGFFLGGVHSSLALLQHQ